jgi:hypothetical protein
MGGSSVINEILGGSLVNCRSFKYSCEMWRLFAEESLRELALSACRSDSNPDKRMGTEGKET